MSSGPILYRDPDPFADPAPSPETLTLERLAAEMENDLRELRDAPPAEMALRLVRRGWTCRNPSLFDAARPPEGTRLILASADLLELFGSRTADGRRLTAMWGEPDEHGWYSPVFRATDDGFLDAARQQGAAEAAELLELAWGVIANAGAGVGDWMQETPEWREAAARWRDRYFAALASPPDAEGGTDV